MMPYVQGFLKLFSTSDSDLGVYKKVDDLLDNTVDVYVEMEDPQQEEDKTHEFVQQTLEYVEDALGRSIKYSSDLRFGLGRVGDGKETELLWWTPLDHPVGAMLYRNEIEPLRVIKGGSYGTVFIHTEANIDMCVETIRTMIETNRSIRLDEEKLDNTNIRTNGLRSE